MSITVDEVADVIRAHRYSYTNEDELQEGIAAALARKKGWAPEREVRLDARDRIDIVVDRIGIEVKVAGRSSGVFEQLLRYAEHEEIAGLILVTNRWVRLPDGISGKPLRAVSLAMGSL